MTRPVGVPSSFNAILPEGAFAAELFAAEPFAAEIKGEARAPLYRAEAGAMRRACAKRRAEFTGVRICARRAMAGLGRAPASIPRGIGGAPVWPAGLTGGMTHCRGLRAAAVAPTHVAASLGIDAEPDRPLPDGVLEAIARPDEIEALRAASVLDRHETGAPAYDRLLFSAKEAAYKCWFPLHRRRVSPFAVEIRFRGRTFRAEIGDGPRVWRVQGRWSAAGGLIRTAVSAPPDHAPRIVLPSSVSTLEERTHAAS